jgi:hypothetical protein
MPSPAASLPEAVRALLNFAPESWPMTLDAKLCDLRLRFIAKPNVGHGRRAIARNGRVLLASDLPLAELPGKTARVRMQTWHKAVLPGDRREPFGILLVVRTPLDAERSYVARLVTASSEPRNPAVEVGGGSLLEFRRTGV